MPYDKIPFKNSSKYVMLEGIYKACSKLVANQS